VVIEASAALSSLPTAAANAFQNAAKPSSAARAERQRQRQHGYRSLFH
jgi:hypothetical protein